MGEAERKARRSEFAKKLDRLRKWLAEERVDGVLLTRPENFAWATAGGTSRAGGNGQGAASLWVDHERAVVLAASVDAARIDEEELDALDVELFCWPWYRESQAEIQKFAGGRAAAADAPLAGFRERGESLGALRAPLFPEEVARYQETGRLAAEAVEAAAQAVGRKETERQVAARLAAALAERGLEPVALLVGADGRVERYRHPVPTDCPIEQWALIGASVRRGGLIASLARTVHFGRLSSSLAQRYTAAVQISAALMAATRPGRTGAQLFDDIARFYAEAGYQDEWELHHQGGATGYALYEWHAAPYESSVVAACQAFAWSPQVGGARPEDTVAVTGESFSVLTAGEGRWPVRAVEVEGAVVQRPDILVL